MIIIINAKYFLLYRRRIFSRIFILLIAVFLCAPGLTSCDKAAAAPQVSIIEDGASDYIIVRPELAPKPVVDAAVRLRTAILDATGVELKLVTDFVARGEKIQPAEHEILIGQTNRTQSADALGTLMGKAYFAGLDGAYVVITGTSDDMISDAVDTFIAGYVINKKTLALPEDYMVKLAYPVTLLPADGAADVGLTPVFTFEPGSGSEYNVEILSPDGLDWKVVRTGTVKAGEKNAEYTCLDALEPCSTYKWRVTDDNITVDGGMFMTSYDYKNHPANRGIDYAFDGTITPEVLGNYLSRAMNHFYFENIDAAALAQNKRFVLNTGAKFIGRSSTMWGMYSSDEAVIGEYAKAIADIHASDPDIIFEGCVFETTFTSINEISVPAWVFTAFGLEPETRNFNYNTMLFPEGDFIDMWGAGGSVPDMRQLETQMWFYYRAALFIDAGFEAIHFGQVHLIGARDKNFECWTKVMNMIRSYASEHARRHFVLLNAHTHGIKGSDGLLLFDFHRFPSRCKVPDSEIDHVPTEEAPQKVIFAKNYVDSLYGRSLGGTTHAGWKTESLPYLVELDNYVGYYPDRVDKASADWWGYDEISWFVNQPYWYQRQYLTYANDWVSKTDHGTGHFEMPGTRTAAIRSGGTITQSYFYPFAAEFYTGGTGVENIIREVWITANAGS